MTRVAAHRRRAARSAVRCPPRMSSHVRSRDSCTGTEPLPSTAGGSAMMGAWDRPGLGSASHTSIWRRCRSTRSPTRSPWQDWHRSRDRTPVATATALVSTARRSLAGWAPGSCASWARSPASSSSEAPMARGSAPGARAAARLQRVLEVPAKRTRQIPELLGSRVVLVAISRQQRCLEVVVGPQRARSRSPGASAHAPRSRSAGTSGA